MMFSTEFTQLSLLLILLLVMGMHMYFLKEKRHFPLLIFHFCGFLALSLALALVPPNGSNLGDYMAKYWLEIGILCSGFYLMIDGLLVRGKIKKKAVVEFTVLFLVYFTILGLVGQGQSISEIVDALNMDGMQTWLIVMILLFFILNLAIASIGYRTFVLKENALLLALVSACALLGQPLVFLLAFLLYSRMVVVLGILSGMFDVRLYGDEPPYRYFVVSLHMQLAALQTLIKLLGLKESLLLLPKLTVAQKKGDLWQDFPEPKDTKDVRSRDQINDAILLYRILKKRFDQEKAEKIIREVIIEAALLHLYGVVPIIKRAVLQSMSAEEQQQMLIKIIERFPNSDYRIKSMTDQELVFEIYRCRFPEFLERLGHPELFDAFCAGDGLYFERYQPDVNFQRPRYIGKGDACCLFKFQLGFLKDK